MNILEAIADPKLFAPWFKDSATWAAWVAFLCALFGIAMTPEQAAMFAQCTGRGTAPTAAVQEAWLICGRRAGKSFVLATVATFLACFRDYRPFLQPGERGTIMVLAFDKRQARTILNYVRGFLTGIPMLRAMLARETLEGFELDNSVTIEIATASHRSVRGYSIVAALLDELAFWPSEESSEPDYAILDALRPGMATIPTAMLLCASSPYSRRGALWDAYRTHYGRDGDSVLVWKASTRVMNPTVPQSVIDAAVERDPAVAAAEYFAEFRTDLEPFVSREAVEACVAVGVRERPPVSGVTYTGFVDPSGGSADSMTLAIGHREGDTVVLDAVRERKPPFSPESVVEEFAALLKAYRLGNVRGDRYGGEWPREAFQRQGITYLLAQAPRSDLYQACLPLLNSRRLDLLDDPKIIAQFVGLERRAGRGGKDSIDHAPGAHDDVVNAIAGVGFDLITRAAPAFVVVSPIVITRADLAPHLWRDTGGRDDLDPTRYVDPYGWRHGR